MLDDLPGDYNDGADWFRYFRMTKYLPAMKTKYKTQIDRAPTPEAARTVMTAYAAAALDVCFFIKTPAGNIAGDLQETFGLHPNNLLTLSVKDIAALARVGEDTLAERLEAAGYRMTADGTIAGFTPPKQPARPTARPAPKS
jgi:hypothetical protein